MSDFGGRSKRATFTVYAARNDSRGVHAAPGPDDGRGAESAERVICHRLSPSRTGLGIGARGAPESASTLRRLLECVDGGCGKDMYGHGRNHGLYSGRTCERLDR